MTLRSEQSWNRRCALEFAGQVFSGLGRLSHAEDIRETAEWALKWLEGDDTKLGPDQIDLGPAPDASPSPAEAIQAGSSAPPGTAAKLRGMREAAQRLRGSVYQTATTENGQEHRELVEVRDAPPRNVPIEGDGSVTPPIYRFYAVHDEPPSTGYILWREDTRNLFGQHRWSQWDRQNERWRSTASTDVEADADRLEAPQFWKRISGAELTEIYHVEPETRHDTEE